MTFVTNLLSYPCKREIAMVKKINSEYIIPCTEYFNVTGGTVDKKNPQSIYYSIGTYIIPTKEINYHSFMADIEKIIKKEVKQLIADRYSCYLEHIVVMEVAEDWIAIGKPSYLDFQIYFKPLHHVLDEERNDFYRVSRRIYREYMVDIINIIHRLLSMGGFIQSKTKTKPIYR